MTQPQPAETGLLDKAMKQVEEGYQKAVDGFNQLVAKANQFMRYASIIGGALGDIAVWWLRKNLEKLRKAMQQIAEWIKEAIKRHTPVLSLIITAFDWITDVKTPVSDVNFQFKEPASYDFGKWSGQARDVFNKKAQLQQDAVAEIQSRSDFISVWLYKIVTSNVNFAAALADVIAGIVGKIVQAVIDAESVIDIPFAIDTVASLVGGLVTDGIKLLTKEVQRVFEEIGALRDLAAIVGDHSKLPVGKWPEAVRG